MTAALLMAFALSVPAEAKSVAAVLALTRAEIVQRMRAPVITQADGLVRVFANCPEDMRREYQGPVAGFASATVSLLYRGLKMRSERFESPRIIVHLGDVRTNISAVVSRVTTNGTDVTTRLYLKSPGGADLARFRVEIARAFYRAVRHCELTAEEAEEALRAADPSLQFAATRGKLEAWLAGDRSKQGDTDDETWDEEHLRIMRKVIEVGVASRRDVTTFASRLYLYPPYFSEPFADGRTSLSFGEAIDAAEKDPRVRPIAFRKAMEIAVFGGGRSEEMRAATEAYVRFLKALAGGESDANDLKSTLQDADVCLRMAWEKAK